MTWGARPRRFWMSAPRRASQLVVTARTVVTTWEAAECWGSQGAAASPSIEKAATVQLRGHVAAFSPHTADRRVSPCTPASGQSSGRLSQSDALHNAAGARPVSEHNFPGARTTTRARGSRWQTSNQPGAVHRPQQVWPGQELRASGPAGPSSEGPAGP